MYLQSHRPIQYKYLQTSRSAGTTPSDNNKRQHPTRDTMSSMERDDLVFMAKVAEQSERYDDMVNFMKQVAEMEQGLTVEERNLLSVAYKVSE